MKLRLYHHPDGARIAYREAGTGPPLGFFHSGGLSHREFEPVVEHLVHRFRVVLPDLPLHGDSEDRPGHPYTPEWLVDVMAGFCAEALGPRPVLAGHAEGAELLLRATVAGRVRPGKLVLMSCRLHRRSPLRLGRAWRRVARAGGMPGLDRAMARAMPLVMRPSKGDRLTARGNPAARDLIRHAFADVPGNPNRARSWARLARSWPLEAPRDLLDDYRAIPCPVLLLWADEDPWHPEAPAREALDLLPDAQLRILPGTGYLMAYDDPVGLAREIVAFCR